MVTPAQLPKLFTIAVQVLCRPELLPKNAELIQRLQAFVKSVYGSIDDATKQSLWQSLSNLEREKLATQGLF